MDHDTGSDRFLPSRLRHEARTPLNAILGMVELLEESTLDATQREYVRVLRVQTEKLLEVVTGVGERNESPPAGPSASLEGMRILLVDDSEDNRFLIERYLRGTQASVVEAVNGDEAVRRFPDGKYDVVLMDLEMPVMDGYAAARAIREWERAHGKKPVRILALTAHTPSETMRQSRDAGCDDLITKPVRKATLLQALTPQADVADVAPAYLARKRAEVPTLREAVRLRDFTTVRSMAHKLAGTGAGYGFPKLSEIGFALERAALGGEAATIQMLLEQLESALEG